MKRTSLHLHAGQVYALQITHYSLIDMPETYEITLTTSTYGGDTMGRLPDARAVFVPFGLPGERVSIRLTEEKSSFARGELIEVIDTSPERIVARCKHFGQCGGCHYQHMPYEVQLAVKADILRDQLQRIGKVENPPVGPMAASPDPWNYRNHVQFHLDSDGRLGFQAPASNKIIPISECHLPEISINSLWPQLEFEANSGIERASIRAGMNDELMLVLESDSPETPEIEIEADISIAHVFENSSVIIAGNDHITINVLGREFRISPNSFFQVNTHMAEKMVTHLLDRLPTSHATILDVYCGVGLFSAFLAPKCKRLIGIESSPSACEDFAINLDEFDHVDLYEDLAENVLPALKVEADIILVDPPRAGVERAALDAIVKMNPKMMAYVSCDPSTLARDARRLIDGGYKLLDVTPFDLFPQTYHIESISFFGR
ncbi:MAG: class I SAM-dependent RNA methyltransferase [Anaerolineales bacterium]